MNCPNVKEFQDLCGYCGKKGHGKSAPACIHQTQCPAYSNRYMPNHMESVCCSKDKPRRLTPAAPSDNEGAIFDALCSIHNMENTHHRSAIPLGYQYDNLSYTWLRKRSTPQPFVNMTVKIVPDDYNAFRCRPVYHNNILLYFCHGRHRMPELPCQYEVHLGLRTSDLLLFNLQLHTATNGDIWILEVTLSACLEKTHRDESLKLGK